MNDYEEDLWVSYLISSQTTHSYDVKIAILEIGLYLTYSIWHQTQQWQKKKQFLYFSTKLLLTLLNVNGSSCTWGHMLIFRSTNAFLIL